MNKTEYNNSRSFLLLPLFLLACMVVLPSVARKKKNTVAQQTEAPAQDTLTANDRKRYDYFFLEASRLQSLGRYGEAFELLQHARDINPNAAETSFYLSMYYGLMKNDSMALACLQRAVALAPQNLTYRERMAEYYIGNQQYDKAIEAYEEVFSKNHDNTDALYILLRLYQQQKDYSKMLSTLERLEVEEGENEKFTLEKMHIYELMNDSKAAYKELKSLVDSHPLDDIYKVMLGNWLMEHQRQKEAYKLYMDVLADEPDNSYAQMSLYDYYNAMGMAEQANAMLDRILLGKNTDDETKKLMLQTFVQENERQGGDSTKVLALFDKMLQNSPKSANVAEQKAAYMSAKNMPMDSVNKALMYVLDLAPDRASARMQLVQNLWNKHDLDGVIAMSEAAHDYNPEEIIFYYFCGMAHYQKQEDDATLDEFRRGIAQVNDKTSPELVSDLYMVMGDILHSKNRKEEAFAAYDSCLQWKADNYPALNNYAYYLCQTGNDLQKAELMSYKTIKATPDSPTFLDTYAWILFVEERYAEAKTYIDQTMAHLDSTQNNSTIWEHAGDIYAMNGLVDKAIAYWKQAQEMGGNSDELAIKIENKRYLTESEIQKYKKKWKKTK